MKDVILYLHSQKIQEPRPVLNTAGLAVSAAFRKGASVLTNCLAKCGCGRHQMRRKHSLFPDK